MNHNKEAELAYHKDDRTAHSHDQPQRLVSGTVGVSHAWIDPPLRLSACNWRKCECLAVVVMGVGLVVTGDSIGLVPLNIVCACVTSNVVGGVMHPWSFIV